MGNSHPRFYGFINATADPVGIAADYLAASMNPNCWGGDHAAIHVENRVIAWLCELLGYPSDAEGILVSGGSMANFTCLAAARCAVTAGTSGKRASREKAGRGSSCTPPTRFITAWTRRWTCSASARTSCARSRPTSASGSARTCCERRSRPTARPGSCPRSWSATPEPSTRAPSIRWKSYRNSAGGSLSGFTWMARMARWPRSPPA